MLGEKNFLNTWNNVFLYNSRSGKLNSFNIIYYEILIVIVMFVVIFLSPFETVKMRMYSVQYMYFAKHILAIKNKSIKRQSAYFFGHCNITFFYRFSVTWVRSQWILTIHHCIIIIIIIIIKSEIILLWPDKFV